MNSKLYLSALICFVFLSCKKSNFNENIEDKSVDTFEISANENIKFQWPSSLIVDEVVYLETTNEALVTSLDKFFISPGKEEFIVVDMRIKKVFFFDQSGKVTRILDRIGPAPDEYIHMRDVYINFKTNKIEILEYKYIQVFDLTTLEYLETISLANIKGDNNYLNLVSIDDVYYLWTPLPSNQRHDLIQITEYNKYHLIRKDGDKVEYFIPFKFGAPIDDKFYPSPNDGEFNLSPTVGMNTIFSIDKDGVKERFHFPFASNTPPLEDLKNYRGNEIEFAYSKYFKGIMSIRETNDYLYFKFTGDGIFYHLLFDTKNKKIISTGRLEDFRVTMIATDSKYFYCYISPSVYYSLSNSGKNIKDHPLLKQLDTSKFQRDDNPIIIKFHIPITSED